MTLLSPLVELRDVSRTYPGPPPFTALRPCTVQIEHGEMLAISGPSGSGKSTLLNLLGMLDRPSTGEHLFDGNSLETVTDGALNRLRCFEIGFVFQDFNLIRYRTAVENVALALLYRGVSRRERISRARQALASVGLAQRMHATPSTLSGGERQRVAIARAIVGSPRLLLCDEPTGNLDSANAASVLQLLRELNNEGHAVVLVTHDEMVAGTAQRRIHIQDGEVTES